MLIDTSSERLNMSASSIPSKDDFTVSMLKDQLKFLGSKIQQATQEIEEKERVIQKLEHEKREFQRKFEHVELENFQMQELMAQSASRPADCLMTGADNGFKTPSLSKQQNKRVLEADGIQCFDLEKQSENSNDDFLLRMSIGPVMQPSSEINEQLKMWQELERVKREKESMTMQLEILQFEKQSIVTDRGKFSEFYYGIENQMALKEELEIVKEELVLKEEELSKYQRHCD